MHISSLPADCTDCRRDNTPPAALASEIIAPPSPHDTVTAPPETPIKSPPAFYHPDLDLTHAQSFTAAVAAVDKRHEVAEFHLGPRPSLQTLPTEIVLQILGHLDVCDLLPASRTCHYLRSLCVAPALHQHRLRRIRLTLPPLLATHNRLSLEDLITRSIFLTRTSVISRQLARSLVSIRLSRRLAARPSAEALVQRAVLPPECVPGMALVHVVPGLVARRRAIEMERVKDRLRRWIAGKWRGEVQERRERAQRRDEVRGVGRVWRLTRFWEQVGRNEKCLVLR